MSLQALPTELDVAIIKYFDRRQQSRMSRASKYYRRITEPLLYSDLQFFNNEDDRIKRLITLVSRKDLRHSITRFDLLHKRRILEWNTPTVNDRFDPPTDEDG
jgi:hypothetical protein